MTISIKFFGVRGSVPAPLTGLQVEEKIARAIYKIEELKQSGKDIPKLDIQPNFVPSNFKEIISWIKENLNFNIRSTYGGNTTCVQIKIDDYPIILDMGTGIRELGKAMIPEILANKGIQGSIFQSHLHWDHLQGLPFWGPLYMPNRKFNNKFTFYGGKSWDSQLETVLRGQMNPPVFPVSLDELRHTAMNMAFKTLWDGWVGYIQVPKTLVSIKILARKLFHPQETFGYRLEYNNIAIAFTTDHEPYAGDSVPEGLKELIDGVDVWITDCQYSLDHFAGRIDGIQKFGWGHSFPSYIAMAGKLCNVKKIITTHHDPSSDDFTVETIAQSVKVMSDVITEPAYEGMEILI